MLNATWVGSHSPTPCYSHGNAVFVSMYQWAEQTDLRAFTFFLSHFQPCLSYLMNPLHYVSETTPSSCLYRTSISHRPAPSLFFSWGDFFSHFSLYFNLSLSPPSLASVELLTFCSHFFANHSLCISL